MREYAKVRPSFWTGETGRYLRKQGPDVLAVSLYLLTCPSSSAIGLYYLPLVTLAHEVGLTIEGARKALQRASEGGFAHYDEGSEVVWVPEMAHHQIGEALKPRDNNISWIAKEAERYRKCPFFADFLQRYRLPYHLPLEGPSKALGRPLEGGVAMEMEMETDIEKEKETEDRGACAPPLLPGARKGRGGQLTLAAHAERAEKPATPLLPSWMPAEIWGAWKDFRKKIKKPLTPHAEKLGLLSLEKLRGQGHDPVAVVNQSIERGWSGFFPLRDQVAACAEEESGPAFPFPEHPPTEEEYQAGRREFWRTLGEKA